MVALVETEDSLIRQDRWQLYSVLRVCTNFCPATHLEVGLQRKGKEKIIRGKEVEFCNGFAHHGLFLENKSKQSICNPPTLRFSSYQICLGRKLDCRHNFQKIVPAVFCKRLRIKTKVFASKKVGKKFRRNGEAQKSAISRPNDQKSEEFGLVDNSPSGDDSVADSNKTSPTDSLDSSNPAPKPSRASVLQACTVTSGLIAALGVIIRQVSHVASVEGWPIVDCSTKISFDFQMWHLELITGLVVLISSCRYLLLQTWPDFAESSEAANQQVLSSLQPLDYIVVASLSGFSEELLFRGAMLPLIGINWKSALLVAIIFGFLHLGSGRKYSFAVWATFVGLAYGYATILSSSIIVPMASHAANNLVGGIIWRYSSNSSKTN